MRTPCSASWIASPDGRGLRCLLPTTSLATATSSGLGLEHHRGGTGASIRGWFTAGAVAWSICPPAESEGDAMTVDEWLSSPDNTPKLAARLVLAEYAAFFVFL